MATKPHTENFVIHWVDDHREPVCQPDPDYPNGIDLDASRGLKPTCTIELPYPAPRCGWYDVRCKDCGLHAACTTAGRQDDPRSLTLACVNQKLARFTGRVQ